MARATLKLLELYLNDIKDNLVTASGDDMLRMQGRGQQLQKIINELTRDPPQIKPGATE